MKSLTLYSLSLFALLLSACGGAPPAADDHGHGHGGHEEPVGNTVSLSAEQIQGIEVELGRIEQKQLTASLKANGTLMVPNQNKASATSLYGGVVQSILVQPGNLVRSGQTIATIANPEFIRLQEEYLIVANQIKLAELDYARQKELVAGNAGAVKNLQQSEAELSTLRTRQASLKKQLQLIGLNVSTLDNDNIASVVSVPSPISGSVSKVLVNIGSHVDFNTPIAEVVDHSQLHLDLYVYERDLPKLRVGQTIHFTLTNNPGKEYDADIYGIGNTFEDASKAIAVHAAVKGDKTGLIDGMSITALVSLDSATVPAVPTEAIVNSEGQDYIFIVSAGGSSSTGHGDHEGHEDEVHADHEGHEDHKGHDHEDHTDHDGHDDHEGHDHANGKGHVGETKGVPVHEHVVPVQAKGALQFERIPVRKGTTDIGYSEITLLKDIPANAQIVTKGAFFLLAKMTNQGEAHAH